MSRVQPRITENGREADALPVAQRKAQASPADPLQAAEDDSPLMTVREALLWLRMIDQDTDPDSEQYGKQARTLQRMAKQDGQLTAVVWGGRKLFHRRDLQAFVDRTFGIDTKNDDAPRQRGERRERNCAPQHKAQHAQHSE